MGFFDKLFGKKEDNISESVVTQQPLDEKEIQNQAQVQVVAIDMSKHNENLGKVLVDMSKGSKVDMTKHAAKVALAMDYSGSMDVLFNNGSVQETVSRLLPIALKFDDNGALESWLFSNGAKKLDPVTGQNYNTYVKNVMKKSGMCMGGTNYAPVLRNIIDYYKKGTDNTPAFVIFITDGANSDKYETNSVIKELSEYNLFVQFIGIGNENFTYLKSLDDIEGRKHDNTGFIAVKDMNAMSDEQLYTEILRQYKDWLNGKQ